MPDLNIQQSIPTQGDIKSGLDQIPRSKSKPTETKYSSLRRMLTISIKTWHDCLKPKRVIPGLVMMLVLPLAVFFWGAGSVNFGAISIYSAAMLINFNLVTMLYWWMLGMIFTILVTGATSGVIADEIDKGTMLILVSKPVSRMQIFLGKFLGVYAFGACMSCAGIFLGGWIAVLFSSGNITHFLEMLPFLFFMFAYSLFVELIFVSISMALSSILRTGRKAMMISLIIVFMTFLIFFIVRMVASSIYVEYSLYWLDIGYHLSNFLAFAMQVWSIIPSSTLWQSTFNMFTGAFLSSSSLDTTQNIDLGGLPLAEYVSPIVSLLIWIAIAVLLTGLGLLKLKRKEITN